MTTWGNDRLLFVHVPKTAGAWAAQAMEAAGVELHEEGEIFHPPLADLDRRGRFTFGFVREPLAWYASTWGFQRRIREIDHGHEVPLEEIIELPFPDFMEGCIRSHKGLLSRHYESFVGSRESPIDFIGYYERLEDDLVRSLRLAGQEFDERTLRSFPPRNVSGPMPPCPPSIRRRLIESEYEAYTRFYPELVPVSAEPG